MNLDKFEEYITRNRKLFTSKDGILSHILALGIHNTGPHEWCSAIYSDNSQPVQFISVRIPEGVTGILNKMEIPEDQQLRIFALLCEDIFNAGLIFYATSKEADNSREIVLEGLLKNKNNQ